MDVEFSYRRKGTFDFQVGDAIKIVVRDLYARNEDEELFYYAKLTEVEPVGFWCVIVGEEEKEEYFAFAEVENVLAVENGRE